MELVHPDKLAHSLELPISRASPTPLSMNVVELGTVRNTKKRYIITLPFNFKTKNYLNAQLNKIFMRDDATRQFRLKLEHEMPYTKIFFHINYTAIYEITSFYNKKNYYFSFSPIYVVKNLWRIREC